MANFLYNGVELPPLPEWDKAKYPYAAIANLTDRVSGLYFLELSSKAAYRDYGDVGTDDAYLPQDSDRATYAYVIGEDNAWEFVHAADAPLFGRYRVDSPVWASYDILNPDGSVFLAASNPINLESKLSIQVGRALNLADLRGEYALRKISALESEKVAFDVGEFPLSYSYCVDERGTSGATTGNGGANIWMYGFSAKAGSRVVIKYCFPECSLSYASQCTGLTLQRTFILFNLGDSPYIDEQGYCEVVLYNDNTLRFMNGFGANASSKAFEDDYTITPIVRNGICVGFSLAGTLTMDANENTGMRSTSFYQYDRLSDGPVGYSTMIHESYDDLTLFGFTADESTDGASETTITFTCSNLNETDSVYKIAAWCYPKGTSYLDAPYAYTSVLFAGVEHSEKWILRELTPGVEYDLYASILVDDVATDHNALVTFTTDGMPELDFSNATLTAESVSVEYTEVSVKLAYSGLPYDADGKSVTFRIVGETDEGDEASVRKITSGSGTVRGYFDDLEPLTDYTATFEIYYNGEPTGVTAEVEFTTGEELPVGGYDRDSFLLGFASGLGATAATKDGAEYNSWTWGYIVGSELRKVL